MPRDPPSSEPPPCGVGSWTAGACGSGADETGAGGATGVDGETTRGIVVVVGGTVVGGSVVGGTVVVGGTSTISITPATGAAAVTFGVPGCTATTMQSPRATATSSPSSSSHVTGTAGTTSRSTSRPALDVTSGVHRSPIASVDGTVPTNWSDWTWRWMVAVVVAGTVTE